MVTVQGLPFADPSRKQHFTAATPDQTRALAWIEALVADPAGSLPTRVWADRQIRAFVPAATRSLSIGATPISRSCHLQPARRSSQYKR